jgi:hypothetical protein
MRRRTLPAAAAGMDKRVSFIVVTSGGDVDVRRVTGRTAQPEHHQVEHRVAS